MSEKKLKIELNKIFKNLKIKKNDKVFMHSNSAGILQYYNNKKSFNIFWKFLNKKIGPKGCVIFPAYNYSNLKKKTINIEKCKSEVGALSNFMINKKSIFRTKNPVFSHLIYGSLKKKLLNSNNYTAFDIDNNFFQKILDEKFKIIGFCCPVNKITLIHYLEAKNKVKYRFNKIFKIKINNKKINYTYRVGKKKLDYDLKEKNIRDLLMGSKNFKTINFGRFECWTITATALETIINKNIKKKENCLII